MDQRFGPGFTNKLQQSLLSLTPSQPRQKTILELFAAGRFIPAQASDYANIEAVGRSLGKIR